MRCSRVVHAFLNGDLNGFFLTHSPRLFQCRQYRRFDRLKHQASDIPQLQAGMKK
jgi:hypothetical protein